jgi:hypothetical protein
MRSALLALLLAVPVLAQLPSGLARLTFRDDIADAPYLAATGDVLWVSSILEDTIERVDLSGATARLDIPPTWPFTTGFVAGPDVALWLLSSTWIARVDPATNEFRRWPIGTGSAASLLLSGPDGNLWFVQNGSALRMRPDGTFLSAYGIRDTPTAATFGSDGALYFAFPDRLTRVDVGGGRTESAGNRLPALYASRGFLWNTDQAREADSVQTPLHEVVRLTHAGEWLATYRIDMVPLASDPAGNLWLRGTTAAGNIVGQLTPTGVLTRFGPFPRPLSTECHSPVFGGFAFLGDGRVAMTDYYRMGPRPMVGPCAGVARPAGATNTIAILDPRVAPVLSIELLEPPIRRRTTRH